MINLRVPVDEANLQPRITVIGVGGAGGNAVNNMIRSNLEGVEFLVCNTDAQALKGSSADRRLQLGLQITKGLGAGASPDKGRAAAEEAIDEIIGYLEGSNMAFITAGMGGGTGTGAGPVIARAAREMDILTVGVVTKPFHFEGAHRMKLAEEGIRELQQYVDTLIVIPNQNLFRIANQKTTFAEAFKMADDVLYSGVRGVTDLMVMPGLINLDFADIRAVMAEMGKAMMGTGEGEGEKRATDAAEAAISNPLLDDVSLKGARAMLINITAGLDISLFEVDEAVNHVRNQVDPDANVIFGSTFDPTMEGKMRVSVVATGIDAASMRDTRTGGGIIMTERRRPVVNISEARSAAANAPAAAAPAQQRFAQPVGLSATAHKLEPEYAEPEFAAAPEMMEAEPEFQPVAEMAPEPQPVMKAPEPAYAPPVKAPAAQSVSTGMRPQVSQEPRAALPHPAHEQKRPGLIERMIGQRQGAGREEELAPRAPAPRPAAKAPVAPPPAAPKSQVSVQSNLGIENAQRGPLPKADDDTLDIPAFLRRQAN